MKKIKFCISIALVALSSFILSSNKPQNNLDLLSKDIQAINTQPNINKSCDLAKKLNIPSGHTFQLGDYTFDGREITDHFCIYFETDKIPGLTAYNVGMLYEEIRTAYSNAGFTLPPNKPGMSKYEIGLRYEDKTQGNTVTFGETVPCGNGKTYPTYIVQYGLKNGINETFRGTAGHEYMHAIQLGSYNSKMPKWFLEAMAEWGKIVIAGCPDRIGGNMKSFIESGARLGSVLGQNEYASVIFPLTITKKYNGSFLPFIKIYDEFAEQYYSSECTQDEFITIINSALSKYGSSLRYPQIHNAMYSYMVNPAQWFGEFGASSPEADWGHLTPNQTETISQTNLGGTKTGWVNASSAKYVKFKIASGLAGDVKYQISFANNSCLSSKYVTQTDDGADHVLSTKVGSTTGSFITYGKEYSDVGLVLTNPTSHTDIQYTITYTFVPKEIKNSHTSYIHFGPNDFQYYDGHGHIWYQLDLTFSVTDVQPLDYDSIEVLGYDFRGYGSFSSRDIYFSSYDSAFHAIFISDSGSVFGLIRILYTYKATL